MDSDSDKPPTAPVQNEKVEKVLNGEEKSNGHKSDEDDVELRKKGAIHSLASRSSSSSSLRSSWSNFTANISSSSVADSVHAHRQQFLQRRARFSDGAFQKGSDSKPSKRFEIELKALKLGEQKSVVQGDSWIRFGKNEAPKSPPYTFKRQGSVRDRVNQYVALTSQEDAKHKSVPEEQNEASNN